MANRIATMRNSLLKALKDLGTPGEWGHIAKQIGMFAYTGLTEQQVERLTAEWHIHLLKSGRISMAGVNSGNVEYLARAMHAVVVGKARV
jgi:aspartate/tyrosine/aromatic aminotransferase